MCTSQTKMCASQTKMCASQTKMCESQTKMCESQTKIQFLGVTHHNTGPTQKRVLLAKEIQRKTENILGFPKVDHSDIDARIVLEQINSAKKYL